MASMTPVSGATEAAASPHVIDVENLEDINDNTIIDVEKECVKTPSRSYTSDTIAESI